MTGGARRCGPFQPILFVLSLLVCNAFDYLELFYYSGPCAILNFVWLARVCVMFKPSRCLECARDHGGWSNHEWWSSHYFQKTNKKMGPLSMCLH